MAHVDGMSPPYSPPGMLWVATHLPSDQHEYTLDSSCAMPSTLCCATAALPLHVCGACAHSISTVVGSCPSMVACYAVALMVCSYWVCCAIGTVLHMLCSIGSYVLCPWWCGSSTLLHSVMLLMHWADAVAAVLLRNSSVIE
ncbi:MAG: hypothetical protein GY938_00575, partial [Ketobacter sp.]|nr:hypothetical protein [Ketobacter sp.]